MCNDYKRRVVDVYNSKKPTRVGNPLKDARLTPLEIQATALHLVDGFSLRQIAAQMGGDHAAASRRLKSGITKLLRSGAFPSCVFRPLVKVTAVSKLGRAFESGNSGLNELIGDD